MHKDDFKQVLENEFQSKWKVKLEILRRIPGFDLLKEESLKSLASSARFKGKCSLSPFTPDFRANEGIVTEGESVDSVTVVWYLLFQ